MSYIQLADPFNIDFVKDEVKYAATVTYVRSEHCCANFFEVALHHPVPTPSFLMKEKPGLGPDNNTMVWMDEKEKINMLYQYIGMEIEKHLKKDLGIFLIDAPLGYKDVDLDHPDMAD